MFSLTTDYERQLKKELFMCHKNMNYSMEDLLRMTVSDRRSFIILHNTEVERENKEIERISKGK